MDKRFEHRELRGFTIDAVVVVGNMVVEQEVTFNPNARDPASSARLYQTIAKLAAAGQRLKISLDAPDEIPPPNNQAPERQHRDTLILIGKGLNPDLCELLVKTSRGRPQPTVTEQHFRSIDDTQGKRAYTALSRGANTTYFYSRELERSVVRDTDGRVLGFDAERIGELANDRPKLAGIRNFGEGSVELLQTLCQRLYLDRHEEDQV
jgi:hypothetical protein